MQKDQIKRQDEQLGDVINVVKMTKYAAEDTGKELKDQNVMLDRLGRRIDETDANMVAVDNKMKHLLKSSKQMWLWIVIIVELVILIMTLSL